MITNMRRVADDPCSQPLNGSQHGAWYRTSFKVIALAALVTVTASACGDDKSTSSQRYGGQIETAFAVLDIASEQTVGTFVSGSSRQADLDALSDYASNVEDFVSDVSQLAAPAQIQTQHDSILAEGSMLVQALKREVALGLSDDIDAVQRLAGETQQHAEAFIVACRDLREAANDMAPEHLDLECESVLHN